MLMKPTEAKILLWLGKAKPELHYAREMARKFSVDYGFLLGTLGGMVNKGWLKKHKSEFSGKAYYELTGKADLSIASELIMQESRKHKPAGKAQLSLMTVF